MINIRDRYFEWMYELACNNELANGISYRKLLMRLNSEPFVYSIRHDENRAQDGTDLRRKFAIEQNNEKLVMGLKGPCSIFEMMLALAIRIEMNIASNPDIGDRTSQWFWRMIVSLGLGPYEDGKYDEKVVSDIIYKFLNHEYAPNGKGGLFTVRNTDADLREFEIWEQMCLYMDEILGI